MLRKIIVDAVSSSGPKASISSFNWTHTMGAGINPAIVICIQARDAVNTDFVVTGVTVGGVAATKILAQTVDDVDGGHMRSEIWILLNPASGTPSVAVTFTGTVDFAGAQAISAFQVKQSVTAHQTAQGSQTASLVNDPSVTITPTKDGCLIIDSVYDQGGIDFTPGASQTSIAQYDPKNGGGDRAFSSYAIQQVAAALAFTWTNGGDVDKWDSVVVALQPAGIEPDAVSNSGAQTTATSYNWNHTVAGDKTGLVVCVQIRPSGASVSSITYGSQNLTKIRSDTNGNRISEIWALAGPLVGTAAITVNLTGSPTNSSAEALSFNGVDQITFNDANNGANSAATTNATVSVTTVADDALIVDSVCAGQDDGVATPAAGQTVIAKITATGAHTGAAGYRKYISPAGATTMNYTITSSNEAISAASFKPYQVSNVDMINGVGMIPTPR